MDINQLVYFIQVCKDGCFSKAAQHLYITQQGLSMAILRMEKELNGQLFLRTTSGLVLTENGRYLLKKANRIVSDYQECENYFSIQPKKKDILTISCVYKAIDWCPETCKMEMFQYDSNPYIKIIECPSLDCETLLEKGDCDLAIVDGPIDNQKFSGSFLMKKQICFVVNKDNPLSEKDSISVQELKNRKLVFENRKFKAYHTLLKLCKSNGFDPNIVLECDRHTTCYSMVKANANLIGSCFSFNEPYINSIGLKMLRLQDEEIPWELYLLSLKGKEVFSPAKNFISELTYWFKNNNVNDMAWCPTGNVI